MNETKSVANQADLDPARMGIISRNAGGQHTITFTRFLRHPIEKVWLAIADPAHRNAWFPQLKLDPAVGGEAVVNFSGGECPPPEDNPDDVYYCEVTVCEPPRLLEYVGPYEHHRYELVEEAGGCTLTFLALVPDADKYDDDKQTIQSRFSVACGWHYMLDSMEWVLDGLAFEDEGYAGPVKVELYLAYLDRQRRQ